MKKKDGVSRRSVLGGMIGGLLFPFAPKKRAIVWEEPEEEPEEPLCEEHCESEEEETSSSSSSTSLVSISYSS